jgi:hypothetical protein
MAVLDMQKEPAATAAVDAGGMNLIHGILGEAISASVFNCIQEMDF